jgi:hypothetical protein
MAKQVSSGASAKYSSMNDLPTVNLSAIVGRSVVPEKNLLGENYQVRFGSSSWQFEFSKFLNLVFLVLRFFSRI